MDPHANFLRGDLTITSWFRGNSTGPIICNFRMLRESCGEEKVSTKMGSRRSKVFHVGMSNFNSYTGSIW